MKASIFIMYIRICKSTSHLQPPFKHPWRPKDLSQKEALTPETFHYQLFSKREQLTDISHY